MEHEELKQAVLTLLIRNNVAIMQGANVLPISIIAKCLKQPIPNVRKALKELRHDGLIEYTYEGGYNEYYERIYCTWGYIISKKVMEFPEYHEERKREEEWWRDSLRFESEVRSK